MFDMEVPALVGTNLPLFYKSKNLGGWGGGWELAYKFKMGR